METTEQNIPGTGRYLKTCRGCKRKFRTDARNARYGPPEVCKCLEQRAKHRAKRAKERRQYHRDPEKYRKLSRTRAAARKKVIEFHDEHQLELKCNTPGCKHNFSAYLEKELADREKKGIGPRGARHAARKKLLLNLHAHHRDHDPFNNYLESYPERSNIELLCRNHHEHADRAKAGKAQIELWKPQPKRSFVDFLVDVRRTAPRRFFTVSVGMLYKEWQHA